MENAFESILVFDHSVALFIAAKCPCSSPRVSSGDATDIGAVRVRLGEMFANLMGRLCEFSCHVLSLSFNDLAPKFSALSHSAWLTSLPGEFCSRADSSLITLTRWSP